MTVNAQRRNPIAVMTSLVKKATFVSHTSQVAKLIAPKTIRKMRLMRM
nr:MAG TPA: hypothetical protein [Caudoviricetes sp.]